MLKSEANIKMQQLESKMTHAIKSLTVNGSTSSITGSYQNNSLKVA